MSGDHRGPAGAAPATPARRRPRRLAAARARRADRRAVGRAGGRRRRSWSPSFVRPAASPIIVVGNRIILLTPESVRRWAIRQFGTDDKPTLLTGIYIGIAVFAVVVGILALLPALARAGRHRRVRRDRRLLRADHARAPGQRHHPDAVRHGRRARRDDRAGPGGRRRRAATAAPRPGRLVADRRQFLQVERRRPAPWPPSTGLGGWAGGAPSATTSTKARAGVTPAGAGLAGAGAGERHRPRQEPGAVRHARLGRLLPRRHRADRAADRPGATGACASTAWSTSRSS